MLYKYLQILKCIFLNLLHDVVDLHRAYQSTQSKNKRTSLHSAFVIKCSLSVHKKHSNLNVEKPQN